MKVAVISHSRSIFYESCMFDIHGWMVAKDMLVINVDSRLVKSCTVFLIVRWCNFSAVWLTNANPAGEEFFGAN